MKSFFVWGLLDELLVWHRALACPLFHLDEGESKCQRLETGAEFRRLCMTFLLPPVSPGIGHSFMCRGVVPSQRGASKAVLSPKAFPVCKWWYNSRWLQGRHGEAVQEPTQGVLLLLGGASALRALPVTPCALTQPSGVQTASMASNGTALLFPFVGCLSRAWLLFSVVLDGENYSKRFLSVQKLCGMLLYFRSQVVVLDFVTQGCLMGSCLLPEPDNWEKASTGSALRAAGWEGVLPQPPESKAVEWRAVPAAQGWEHKRGWGKCVPACANSAYWDMARKQQFWMMGQDRNRRIFCLLRCQFLNVARYSKQKCNSKTLPSCAIPDKECDIPDKKAIWGQAPSPGLLCSFQSLVRTNSVRNIFSARGKWEIGQNKLLLAYFLTLPAHGIFTNQNSAQVTVPVPPTSRTWANSLLLSKGQQIAMSKLWALR